MADQLITATVPRPLRAAEPKRQDSELPQGTLVVGVDNLRHDVALSPKFVEATRTLLFDLIRQKVNLSHFPGFENRPMRAPELGGFRKMVAELLQNSLTRAKAEKNIERDLLLRVALLRFLTQEVVARFSDVLLEAKEGIRARGSHFERSEMAHVMQSRLAEIQASRRDVVRHIGQQLHQILVEVEDTVTGKTRKGLFGDEASRAYAMLLDRLVFVEGGRDDRMFLDHYVLIGNFVRDPDRFEVFDQMLAELVEERGASVWSAGPETASANGDGTGGANTSRLRADLAKVEQERAALMQRLGRSDELLTRMLRRDDPAELRAALVDIDRRRKYLQDKFDQQARQAGYVSSNGKGANVPVKPGDPRLSDPENVDRLFSAEGDANSADPRARLLSEWVARLEQSGLLPHVLASYEIRNLHAEYCPPLHLQQLRRSLVSREELKRAEDVLKQFSAKQLSAKRLEESSRRLRRYSPQEIRALAMKFAEDLIRLRRDLADYQTLTGAMERINLLRDAKTAQISRMNRTLYEFLLPVEEKPAEDHVVNHAILKADIRGSTKLTQDLLARGLNPASHMSMNLYEPVQRILERYGASKVFIEGDAIVLAIYETEANRTRQRAVAKACLLARQILAIAQSYNDRAAGGDLPPLELGVGVAFQNSPPTYWMDNDYRIMISRAINLSDRLSSCSKAARRLLGDHRSPFHAFLFQTAIEGTTEEELDEFLLRYNLNGIVINEEGFQKLGDEISLTSFEAEVLLPWGRERAKFYTGLVPIGETLEPLTVRQGFVRQIMPDGKIGHSTKHIHYEVCVNEVVAETKR
jgi:hypothetical protein